MNSTDLPYPHIPSDVVFEYVGDEVIPAFAKSATGSAYTGNAEGAIGAADWYGPFVDGRPHGTFLIIWGGIKGGNVQYHQGQYIGTA